MRVLNQLRQVIDASGKTDSGFATLIPDRFILHHVFIAEATLD
jgi:hypothetical protein